jgi:hypothetical protein
VEETMVQVYIFVMHLDLDQKRSLHISLTRGSKDILSLHQNIKHKGGLNQDHVPKASRHTCQASKQKKKCAFGFRNFNFIASCY